MSQGELFPTSTPFVRNQQREALLGRIDPDPRGAVGYLVHALAAADAQVALLRGAEQQQQRIDAALLARGVHNETGTIEETLANVLDLLSAFSLF
jgi:hypothetical protein